MTQTETQLELNLITRLTGLGYERVDISSAEELRANLKKQLESHNKKQLELNNNSPRLSDLEFKKVLNHLDKGNVFERAKTLRDRMQLTRDDGSSVYIQFLDSDNWCQNRYQVTHQITMTGKYENRYDVTLLINGLPLVQIELKRRGMELKEAFNQINRYQRHSFSASDGLFLYVQLFVISNGVNTKYYANNRKQSFKQTFYWADEDNTLITQLDPFTDAFLEKCHLSKMICKYIVLHESDKILMVLRPYQYYAVEAIINRVEESTKNGYIWHTTGSGKTLTSYKAAQILTALPTVDKVLFVVDRADLDYQTTREFNFFSDGSVDGTDNTKALVKQLSGKTELIVTTIQKLNTAITTDRYEESMANLKDERIVFIFDECHRSQFGDTHKRIVSFFNNAQMFGFTGTPIFAPNASKNDHGKRTTKDLFDDCLHRYVITNAIADENVLKFSVEYWGKLKQKDGSLIDEQVSAINKKEFFESEERIENIVDWVILNHNRKTDSRIFSAMFCVSSVQALITYYEAFKRKKEAGEHDLRVITIFTYAANEEDEDANGLIGEPNLNPDFSGNKHSRERLDEYIADYNAMYDTQHSASNFYTYYKDIAKRMKERDREDFQEKDRADILLVVNMYLTGFDAKKLNTLYVDKNLKYHGLIQAYSRTNRILGERKSQGNIVCFRNLKKNTDEAITLFSNANAQEEILLEPYETYVGRFNEAVAHLQTIAATPDAVNDLINENDQVEFVRAYRELMRSHNVLKSFTEFEFTDLDLEEQVFVDFRSKYLDIRDRVRSSAEEASTSILGEVDFELELIQRDEINVAYILQLLSNLQQSQTGKDSNPEEYEQQKQAILDMVSNQTQLRSKRDLIEKFVNNYMPTPVSHQTGKDFNLAQQSGQEQSAEAIKTMFSEYWTNERRAAVNDLCKTEGLKPDVVQEMIAEYHYSNKEPLREAVFAALEKPPKVLERKSIFGRVVAKLLEIVQKFDDGIGDL